MISRRTAVGMGVGLGLAATLPGCKPCFPAQAPKHSLQPPGPRTLTVRARIKAGEYRLLRAILDDPSHDPFEKPGQGIHYARLFTTDQRSLFFMIIYDEYAQALSFLGDNADGVDRLFMLCEDYPKAGAGDRGALRAFVERYSICVELFYRAYNTPQPKVRDALTLREHFLAFVRRSDELGGSALAQAYAELFADPHLLTMLSDRQRKRDDVPGPDKLDTSSDTALRLEPMAGDGRVNPFTLHARIKPGELRKVRRTLELGTFATIDLNMRPLKNLPTLHFARVSIINGDEMLFASVYDGDFIQYVEDFGTRIASQIDKVFGACVGYPMAGSRDVGQFKEFLRSHQVQTQAFGGSYLRHTLLEIQASLALSDALAKFWRCVDPEDRRLRAKLDRFLHKHQLLLS